MASRTSSGNPSRPVSAPITKVEQTSDTLTGRGGLTLFSRYLRGLDLYPHLERLFGPLKKSGKGVGVSALFHQLFCFLVDGTSRHLVHFDRLKEDDGYARGIETEPEEMASSHAVKRFFYAFGWGRIWVFRYLLLQLFEELGIGYVCTSPLEDELTDRARRTPAPTWSVYDNGHRQWKYFEFGNRRKSWRRDGWRRAFYTRPVYEDEQRLLRYARPDTVLYTNLASTRTWTRAGRSTRRWRRRDGPRSSRPAARPSSGSPRPSGSGSGSPSSGTGRPTRRGSTGSEPPLHFRSENRPTGRTKTCVRALRTAA